jgi:hypothetical protein
MCFGPAGHEGGHQWDDWRGWRVRLPEGDFTVPFGGFAGEAGPPTKQAALGKGGLQGLPCDMGVR